MKTESDRLLDLAEEGLYKKVSHVGCSDSKSVGLYSEAQRVHWYCYKCGESGHRKLGQKSITELLEIQNAKNATKDKQDKSTKDFVSSQEIIPKDAQNVPMNKRDWLYGAGFSDEMVDSWYPTIYYSPKLNRIGITNNLIGFRTYTQLRSIDGTYPKYLNRGGDQTLYRIDSNDFVILVEDWLSALRLIMLNIPVLCLFGTNLKDIYITRIKHSSKIKEVYIWLDNDTAGHKGTKEAKRSLRFYTELDVKVITTLRDPKMYTDEYIKEIVDEARSKE